MDRRIVYNGRVSKVDKPVGMRPSDYRRLFLQAFEEHAACKDIVPNLLNIVVKNGNIEAYDKKGNLLLILDPSTGQVIKADEREQVAG